MTKRIIWRLEHKTLNIGPHWITNKDNKLCDLIWSLMLDYGDDTHPVPQTDNCFPPSDWKNACYGAPSLKKLLHWFPRKYMARLAECGFVVRSFRVNGYIAGDAGNQVVFDRNNARVFKEMSPLDFA